MADERAVEPGSASAASGIPTLIDGFEHPLQDARARHAAGERVVGATTHTVPWEMLRAAGLSPVVVRPTRRPAALCLEYLEPGIFSPRIASLFEMAVAGDLACLSALTLARTSEQDYKAYLYLREVVREGRGDRVPALWFYDLLHSSSAHAYEYGLARTRDLAARLKAETGHVIRAADLESAVEESNAARAAVRRLLALRQGAPRLSGAEALALTGSLFLMDRTRYAMLAHRAADEAEQRAPLTGPRLVIAGAWLDHARLHTLLESHGAVVVAEDGGWGTRSAGQDIERRGDLVAAIFDKYYRDGPSVRQFAPSDHAWLHGMPAADIDGVVFYLPPDDSVMGWDYPTERRRLDALGIPSLVIRDEVDDPGMATRWGEAIAAFVGRAGRAGGARG
jgi:benzoyl-CoA reductase/2-hydroxyglutaryl-CoA dehydratase subunit BcrC/BadD/HgdB